MGEPNPPVSIRVQSLSHSAFSGPLPPPEILKEYQKILPGAADRIITMAERQMAHRHTLERSVTQSDIWKSYLGMMAAFLIAMSGIGAGSFLVYWGHDWAGVGFFSTSLVTIVTVFITGTASRRAERLEKARLIHAQAPNRGA